MSDDEHTGSPPSRGEIVAAPLVDAPYTSATLLIDECLADMIADGDTMVDACDALGLRKRDVYRRIAKEPQFAQLLEEARRIGFDVIANRVKQTLRGRGPDASGDVKRDRLIAEYDMKLLAKWHPKAYGEKLEIETTNRNMDVPVSDDPVEASKQYDRFIRGT